ncbi:MAG: leucine--tRNA ligase [Opitutales bacterium]|nr:leucine--tRNA ligase [Opitutales bacterium]
MAVNCSDYAFQEIESHWQGWWKANRSFEVREDTSKPKYYLLDMFPYPSGAGLHVGHVENFAGSDVLGRYKKARGFNVLHPMGWDAFGLPAEQYAVKTGTHPESTTRTNIENFRGQLDRLGLALDWSREVNTTDPHYYRWTQWIFLQLFRKGLAYVDERPVNWCPALGTVLANEEVIEGKSEVGGHPVERRNLRQWVLRITAYADKLLAGLDEVDWPDSTKTQQRNWIGRSTGAEVRFALENGEDSIEVYTTRPDTLFGATYMVLAPEHPLTAKLTTAENKDAVAKYVEAAAHKSDLDRTELAKDKSGVFSGSYAINPVNDQRIPIWIADYVLMGYGTGAIMAVPAHDERDFEFAQKFELPIIPVIQGSEDDTLPYTGPGKMVNSGRFDGQDSTNAKAAIIDWLESESLGKAAVNFKLRDWLFSRQRYWGEPFPIVWVERDAFDAIAKAAGEVAESLPESPVTYMDGDVERLAVPVPNGQLPVTLPPTDDYKPSGSGESPLARVEGWVDVWFNIQTGETLPGTDSAPNSNDWVRARRETNTMPQWAGSCWYYLRYLDPKNPEQLLSDSARDYWGSPDFYLGGNEHAVLHLLYARFWHRFLYDEGVLKEPEPFRKLFHQGIVLAENGEKMSKSRGNVVNPDDYIKSHGADSLRTFLMFMGPLEESKPWNTQGIEGVSRFLKKVWREVAGRDGGLSSKLKKDGKESAETLKILHQSIRKVTDDFENIRFNTAISQLMILVNHLSRCDSIHIDTARALVRMVAPLAPHMAEELWERLGEQPSVCDAGWPEFDGSLLVEDQVQIGFLVNGKPRGEGVVAKDASQEDVLAIAQANEKVQAHIDGKTIRKVIYVPGKILNLVVG